MLAVLTQIIPLLVSAFGSAFAVYLKNKAQDHAAQMQLMTIQNEHQIKFMEAQRQMIKTDKHFAWTRRTLALTFVAGFFTVVWVLPIVGEQFGIIYEIPARRWFLGLFQGDRGFEVVQGVPSEAYQTLFYTIQAIVGLYFGQSMMKR